MPTVLSEHRLEKLARVLNDTKLELEDALDDLRFRYHADQLDDLTDQLQDEADLFKCGVCGTWRSSTLISPTGGCDLCVGGLDDEEFDHEHTHDGPPTDVDIEDYN